MKKTSIGSGIMRRLNVRLSNRKGFTLILGVMLLTVFIGAAVMAIDVGHAHLTRADLQAAADAAALAGIEEYGRGCSVGQRVERKRRRSRADSRPIRRTSPLAGADFALGFWSGTAFTPGGADTNAAQVTLRHTTNFVFGSALWHRIA